MATFGTLRDPRSHIVVVTFNLIGQSTDERNGWHLRSKLAGQVLKSCNPDLIGFQEFGHNNWESLSIELPKLVLYDGEVCNEVRVNPIAYTVDRFTTESTQTIWLTEDRSKKKSWDADEVRALSLAVFRDDVTKRRILHINVHFDNIGEVARIRETQILLEIVAEYLDIPVIITGDFNCNTYRPHTGGMSTRLPHDMLLNAGFADAWSKAHNAAYPPHNTFHNFLGKEFTGDPYGTYNPDRIYVKGLTVVAAEMVRENNGHRYPSDHYPVMAVVDFPTT